MSKSALSATSSGTAKAPKQAHRVPPYKRPIVVGGFLVILAVVVVVTIFIFRNFNNKTALPSSDNQSNSSSEITSPEPISPSADDDLENKAPQFEGEDPNNLDELTGVIVYQDIDPETLILHSAVSINQYLQEDGQCVFNLKRDDAVIRTTSAIAEPDITTSVCGPFAVSVDGLVGTYQIEVLVTGDGKRGTIIGEITI